MTNRFSVLLILIALAGLISCKNNDNVFKRVVSSSINVVNASADTLNFYLNGTRQNSSSSIYPSGQSFYITVPQGGNNFQFKKAGSPNVLFSVPSVLKDSTYYSLYVYGTAADKTLTVTDQLLVYTQHPDTTQVKLVNVSPDAGNLDVTVGSTVAFQAQGFKATTEYALMDGGALDVKVFQTGSATPLKDTTITFQPGGIYTLYTKGLLNGKGNLAFDIGVVINSLQ